MPSEAAAAVLDRSSVGEPSVSRRLAVVAPEGSWRALHDIGAGLELDLVERPEPKHGSDPYALESWCRQASPKPAALLLVAPRRRSPARLVGAPVLHGVPVGIVPADSPSDLAPWCRALADRRERRTPALWAVLAMWKPHYLRCSRLFARGVGETVEHKGARVEHWPADEISRHQLCRRLAKGPALAVYFGHGRARGWSGYRGVRWSDLRGIEPARPCGVVMSFACDTLRRMRGKETFGARWIEEGRACAYLGSTTRVQTLANASLVVVASRVLAAEKPHTVGAWLAAVDAELAQRPKAAAMRRAFRSYRLLGNPLQPLVGNR